MQGLVFRDIPDDPNFPELVQEAWDQFRGMGYADLAAVQEELNRRRESLTDGQNAHHTETERGRTLEVLRARARAAGMLRQWIEENGTGEDGNGPPEWSELVAPKQTRKWAQKAQPHLEDGMSIRGLCELLAEKEGVSDSTPYKWLCARNPHYFGPEGGEEMQELREIINRICSRTSVNGSPS